VTQVIRQGSPHKKNIVKPNTQPILLKYEVEKRKPILKKEPKQQKNKLKEQKSNLTKK